MRNDQLVKPCGRWVGIGPVNPYRVLLVDDDVHLLDLYREVLQEAGFRFFSAPTILSAWHCCRRMIRAILDLNMPGCSGLEFSKSFGSMKSMRPRLSCSCRLAQLRCADGLRTACG